MSKKIRITMKGTGKSLDSDPVEAAEADRLLAEEVEPKIGKEGLIRLPGVVVDAKEVVSAQALAPSAPPSMPRASSQGSVLNMRF